MKLQFFGTGPWAEATRLALAQQSDYQLVDCDADVGVVVHYGKILPATVLQSFRYGVLNIHPSLLPAWRGPSPLQAAILNGDTTTGVSVMVLDSKMDTGPLLVQHTVPLLATAQAQLLYPQLFQLGTELLLQVLPKYISGEVTPQPQATTGVSYSHIIERNDGKINRSDSAVMIDRKFRAYHPWPGIFCIWRQQRIKLTKVVLTPNGNLDILEVQPSGKKAMPYSDFLRGRPDFTLSAIL